MVDVAGAAPDPKSHDHVTPAVVPVLKKSTGMPVHCGALEIKLAVGVALIVMVFVVVVLQCASKTVKLIVLVPAVEYTIPLGFSVEDDAGDAPGPKSHEYLQLPPVDPVLVKSTPDLVQAEAGAVKVAVGD